LFESSFTCHRLREIAIFGLSERYIIGPIELFAKV
jgi:hypothetical protein